MGHENPRLCKYVLSPPWFSFLGSYRQKHVAMVDLLRMQGGVLTDSEAHVIPRIHAIVPGPTGSYVCFTSAECFFSPLPPRIPERLPE